MKTRTIIYVFVALLLGLMGGYFLFGAQPPGEETLSQGHNHGPVVEGDEKDQVWTCSMHPQIQQSGPGDCPLCGMDLIPLETGNTNDPLVLTMTKAAVALAGVQTMVVEYNRGTSSGGAESLKVKLAGRLAPDERTVALEVSEYGGRIERLFVSFSGERVRAGQRIATVYAPEVVVAQEEFLQARELSDINPELVAAARAKLKNLKVTDEQINQLEQTGEPVREFPVYADHDGTILETKAEVGEYLPAGGALYTYTDLSRLWALFDAYEDDLGQIRVGDPVTFRVSSRPGESFRARVGYIDPVINPETRTAAVRAEISNRTGGLKPQMFVEGVVSAGGSVSEKTSGVTEGNLVVPSSALLWTGERSVVYVADPETAVPTYEFREVTIGERVAEGYRILSGLEAGEAIVISGAFQVDAAAQLNNKASMINREVVIQGRRATGSAAEPVPDFRGGTPEQFKEQLGRLVETYLPVKDRLVATELVTENLITPLEEALAGVNMQLVRGEAHQYWMQQSSAMDAHAKELVAKDAIEQQRRQFSFLTQALLNTLKAFGVEGEYYVQHCPMAFDNTGANWLSDEKQILNPYFGDLMLNCGIVTEEFKTN